MADLARRMVIACWFLSALAGVVGMSWSLWWNRDRKLYQGLAQREQRELLFQRAGLNPTVLPAVELADQIWPKRSSYTVCGDANTASYVMYMLAPRIPSESAVQVIDMTNGGALEGRPVTGSRLDSGDGIWRPMGWVLSAFAVFGAGKFVSWCLCIATLSVPETAAIGALCTHGVVVVGRALGVGMPVLGCLLSLVALCGWIGSRPFAARRRGRDAAARCDCRGNSADAREPLLTLGLAALSIGAVWLAGCLATVVVPDDWDAWAIWGAKAKVLALGEGPLADVTHFGHADYPLLWPSVWAFSGWCSGGWEEQWSRGWSAIFLLLTGWQLAGVPRQAGGDARRALLSCALFVSIPKVVVVASWGYAEAPLWLFSTCAMSRLVRSFQAQSPSDFFLSGLFAAGAALTKNEGVLVAALLLTATLVWTGVRGVRLALWFLFSFGLAYLPWWLWVRWDLALGSHATDGLCVARISAMGSRILPALQAVCRMYGDWRQWGLSLGVIMAGTVAVIGGGARTRRFLLVVPVGFLLGSLFVLIGHTTEIHWQVGTSWDRLTIQALPLFIVALTAGRIPSIKDPADAPRME